MKNELLLDSTMNDMVFEYRNKAYGAYQLRGQYDQRMATGLFVSVAIFASLFLGLAAYSKWKTGNEQNPEANQVYTVVELDNYKKEFKPRIAVTPAIKATLPTQKKENLATKVVREDEKENPVNPDTQIHNRIVPGPIDTIGGIAGPEPIPGTGNPGLPIEQPDPGTPETPLPMYQVEEKPMFPGGEAAMYKYLREHLQYPLRARENKISGTVVVQFIVNDKGQTENVVIVRSASSIFNPGSISVIEQMPAWKPGKNNGKPVSVIFTLPLTYQLL